MKLASGIGIIHKDLILLAKRVEYWEGNPVPLGGYWSIFAGSLEGNESFQDCAIRETYEESEIKIDNIQLVDGCVIKGNNLRFKIEILCIDHPLLITFAIGFILGAIII